MLRDELIDDIVEEVKKVVSDNRTLDTEDLEDVLTACTHTLNCAEEAIDEDEAEEAKEAAVA